MTAAVSDAIQNMADAVAEAVGKVVSTLGTIWVSVGTPNLTSRDGGSTPSDAVAFIQDSLWFYMAGAAVLAVIVGGARMAWERRAEPGREVLKSLLTLTVVSGAGLTGIALAVGAADGFAEWIIDRSTEGTDFGTNITGLIALSAATGSALGPLLVIILGLVAIFASFVQIMLMVVRGGMLVILAGILPLAASFTSTEMGRAWFKKCLGWTLAFILYKPAAAIVYATAFRLTGTDVFGDDGSGLMDVLVGLVLMVLALVALPALLRFTVPMVSQMASGAGGAALGAGALAAMPTGAIPLAAASRASGTRGSGGGGAIPTQPSGSGGGSEASGAAGTGGSGRPGGGSATPASSGPRSGAGSATGSVAGQAAGVSSAAGSVAGGAAAAGPAGLAVVAADGARRGVTAARQAAQAATEEQEGPRGSN